MSNPNPGTRRLDGSDSAKGHEAKAKLRADAAKFVRKRFTEAQWGAMCDAQYEKALTGDTAAFKILWEAAHGKPQQGIDAEVTATISGDAMILALAEARRQLGDS